MAKGSGTTRASSSGNPKGLQADYVVDGVGYTEREFLEKFTDWKQGEIHDTKFSRYSKIIDFQDEGQMVNGGSYSITTDDGYTMTIETVNGYNENYGSEGTLINVYVTSPKGETSLPMGTSFVEGRSYRQSGGANVYSNDSAVKERINKSMPYYAELANKWKKNH